MMHDDDNDDDNKDAEECNTGMRNFKGFGFPTRTAV